MHILQINSHAPAGLNGGGSIAVAQHGAGASAPLRVVCGALQARSCMTVAVRSIGHLHWLQRDAAVHMRCSDSLYCRQWLLYDVASTQPSACKHDIKQGLMQQCACHA